MSRVLLAKSKAKLDFRREGFDTELVWNAPVSQHSSQGAALLKALFRVRIKGAAGLVVISGATAPSTHSGLLVLSF